MTKFDKIKLTEFSHGAGWACKIGPDDLAQVLSDFNSLKNDKVVVGFDTNDDAAAVRIGDNRLLVQTVDVKRPQLSQGELQEYLTCVFIYIDKIRQF